MTIGDGVLKSTKQQKVKISKYGAMVVNVCGKEVSGSFWGDYFIKYLMETKTIGDYSTRRTLCWMKHREGNY